MIDACQGECVQNIPDLGHGASSREQHRFIAAITHNNIVHLLQFSAKKVTLVAHLLAASYVYCHRTVIQQAVL